MEEKGMESACPETEPAEAKLHKILFLSTSSNGSWTADGTTGLWFDELTTPYYAFIEAGFSCDICSIRGGEPPLDSACVNAYNKTETTERFLQEEDTERKLKNTKPLHVVLENDDIYSYACLFLLGGHGCVDDFPDNVHIKEAVEKIYVVNKGCIAAICHGSLGLSDCLLDGKHILKGKFIAAFSNEEEEELGLIDVLPILTEKIMDDIGAICVPAAPWKPHAVVDGRIVTGQNPQSSLEVAHRVLDVLRSLGDKFSPPENVNKPWGS